MSWAGKKSRKRGKNRGITARGGGGENDLVTENNSEKIQKGVAST